MAREYATLELRQDVTTKGGATTHDIVVYRPTTRELIDILGEPRRLVPQTQRFVKHLCRAKANGSAPEEFDADQIDTGDITDLNLVLSEMLTEADGFPEPPGDGINEPITYTLVHPIKLTERSNNGGSDGMTIEQIQFQARRMRDVTDFLDAPTGQDFPAFMRGYGTLLGVNMPMSDSIIYALDFVDYLAIRRKIMGKLTAPRRRWTKL